MNTFLNEEIETDTLAILYLCEYSYTPPSIKVIREIQFKSPFEALEAYSNIPNPESQMASGKDRDKFFSELEILHKNLTNPKWIEELGNYL